MSHAEFTPPISRRVTLSKSEGPDGYVNSVSLLLSDAHSRFFSLHVATQANFVAASAEAGNDGEFPEPVFVVPTMTIDDPLIERIINTDPEILSKYLVPQLD